MAKQLAAGLEPHRPFFIEEPLLPGHVNELKDLYNKTNIPIAVSSLARIHLRYWTNSFRLAWGTTFHSS